MDILILILFLTVFLYNLSLKKKMICNVKKKSVSLAISGAYILIALFMTYKLYNRPTGYALVLSSVLLIYSFIFFQGIGRDGVLVALGSTSLLKLVKKEDIEEITMEEIKDKDEIKVVIQAHGTTYRQVYRLDQKEKIRLCINNLQDRN